MDLSNTTPNNNPSPSARANGIRDPRLLRRAISTLFIYALVLTLPLGAYLIYTQKQDDYFTGWRFRQLQAIATEFNARTELAAQILGFTDFASSDKTSKNWPSWLRNLKVSYERFDAPSHNSLALDLKQAKDQIALLDDFRSSRTDMDAMDAGAEREELARIHQSIRDQISHINANIDCFNRRNLRAGTQADIWFTEHHTPILRFRRDVCDAEYLTKQLAAAYAYKNHADPEVRQILSTIKTSDHDGISQTLKHWSNIQRSALVGTLTKSIDDLPEVCDGTNVEADLIKHISTIDPKKGGDKLQQAVSNACEKVKPLYKKQKAYPQLFVGGAAQIELSELIPERFAGIDEFDTLILAKESGEVLYQRRPILGGHIPQAKPTPPPEVAAQAESNALASPASLLTEDALGAPQFADKRALRAGGHDYFLFCTPLKLAATGGGGLQLCALIEKQRFNSDASEIPTRAISLFLVVLLICAALMPFLKLALMSRNEAFRKWDFATVRLGMITGSGLIALLFLEIGSFRYMLLEIDTLSRQFAKAIATDVKRELVELRSSLKKQSVYYEQLSEHSKTPIKNHFQWSDRGDPDAKNSGDPDAKKSVSILRGEQWNITVPALSRGQLLHPPLHAYPASSFSPKSAKLPPFEVLFNANAEGLQMGPVLSYRNDLWLGVPATTASSRRYFKQALGRTPGAVPRQPGSVTESCDRYAVERIRERTVGVKLTAVALPANTDCSVAKPGQVAITFGTRHLYSLYHAVLPPGFGYAVLDKSTGEVLYHSDDDLSLVENFASEVDPAYALPTATEALPSSRTLRYHGRAHRFYAEDLDPLPWRLVVYHDLELLETAGYQTTVLTLSVFAAYVFFYLIFGLLVQWFTRRQGRDRPFAAWLWPHYLFDSHYPKAIVAQLILAALALLSYFWCPVAPGWSWLIPTLIVFFPFLVVLFQAEALGTLDWRHFKKSKLTRNSGERPPVQSKYRFLTSTSLYFFNLGIVPLVVIFCEVQYFTSNNLAQTWRAEFQTQNQHRAHKIVSDLHRINPWVYRHGQNAGANNAPGYYARALCERTTARPAYCIADNSSEHWLKRFVSIIPVFDDSTELLYRHHNKLTDTSNHKIELSHAVTSSLREPVELFDSDYNEPVIPLKSANSANSDNSEPPRTKRHLFPELIVETTASDEPASSHRYFQFWLTSGVLAIILIWLGATVFVPWMTKRLLGTSLRRPTATETVTPASIDTSTNTIVIRPALNFAAQCEAVMPNTMRIHLGLDNIGTTEAPVWLNAHGLEQYDYFILDAFESHLNDQAWLAAKLQLIETILGENKHMLILTQVSLPYRVTVHTGSGALLTNDQAHAWSHALSNFSVLRHRANSALGGVKDLPEVYAEECYWDAQLCEKICAQWQGGGKDEMQKLARQASSKAMATADSDVTRWVMDVGRARFREIWSLCTEREKIVLYRIANGCLMNPANVDIIEHLLQRQLLVHWPDFQVASPAFRQFIREAEDPETVQAWEARARTGLWASVRRPLVVLFTVILVLLISTQTGVSQALTAILTAFAGGIPLVTQLLARIRNSAAPGA